MPELPDITLYQQALQARVVGQTLLTIRVRSPFVLRTVDPPIDAAEGRRVSGVARLGKRILLELDRDLFLIVHLMIAGRLKWKPTPSLTHSGSMDIPRSSMSKLDLLRIDFTSGSLTLIEPSKEKRAGIWLVHGRKDLESHRRAGLDVLTCAPAEFATRLRSQNRTLKRALTDPTLFDGIGNAYSDEILHAARLSPIKLSASLDDESARKLHSAAKHTLESWTTRLLTEFGYNDRATPVRSPLSGRAETTAAIAPPTGRFPEPREITAFRPDFAVHGRFDKPCPVCGHLVQRIVYAMNETNYCPTCQCNGKVLADRSLSRLLRGDWPRTVEELED